MATATDASDLLVAGTRLISALTGRDWTGLESCFQEGVQFRALIPPGFREAKDRAGAVGHLKDWFGAADEVILLGSEVELVEDKLGVSYRVRLHEDQWYIVEQQLYCDVTEGRIRGMDLLCSGFRPASAPSSC